MMTTTTVCLPLNLVPSLEISNDFCLHKSESIKSKPRWSMILLKGVINILSVSLIQEGKDRHEKTVQALV